MRLTTHLVEEKQKALIVAKKKYSFISLLKEELINYSIDVFFSSQTPNNTHQFDYCFIINDQPPIKNHQSQIIVILIDKKAQIKKSNNIKVIRINNDQLIKDDIDRILWFSLSKNQNNKIDLIINVDQEKTSDNLPKKAAFFSKNNLLSKSSLIKMAIASFLISHFIFIFPLILSLFFTYQSYNYLLSEQISRAKKKVELSIKINQIAKTLYAFPRSTYLLVNLALLPDNLFDITEKSQTIIKTITSINDYSTSLQELILNKQKNDQQIKSQELKFVQLENDLNLIGDHLDFIAQKITLPFNVGQLQKIKLIEMVDLIQKSRKVTSYIKSILSSPEEKKYLIMFANNMEIRPGGGFIGSFGIISISNYSFNEIKIYDVYDADGQLAVHIEPPMPIAKYLNMPHWFLRDSNFSPDFYVNYQKALFFIDKEMGLNNFHGGILVTTTAIENILKPFGNIYLPNTKEIINSQNFYLKTQSQVEKNFFPGSIQKKTYLSSIVNQLLIQAPQVSIAQLTKAIKTSLDEKQLVVYVEDQDMQSMIDNAYWSGRLIEARCPIENTKCIIDFLYPFDANLGTNKANFYVNRYFNLKSKIDRQGVIHHLFSVQYINNSPGESFPTGYYRNYFQLLIPQNATIRSITQDGVLIDDYDISIDKYQQIGFLVDIAPKKTVEIKVDYYLNDQLVNGNQIYQLIVQKQIGANNSDLVIEFETDKNIYLVNNNFSPIVKGNQMIYNSSLSADKIFLTEIIKDSN